MRTLRLITTFKCDKDCDKCCNKTLDHSSIQEFNGDVSSFDNIVITGGEPLLFPANVQNICATLPTKGFHGDVIVYTSKADNVQSFITACVFADGITMSLHTQDDVVSFENLNTIISENTIWRSKSLRLKVFDGLDISHIKTPYWSVEEGVKWMDECPLPDNEVLMKIKKPW